MRGEAAASCSRLALELAFEALAVEVGQGRLLLEDPEPAHVGRLALLPAFEAPDRSGQSGFGPSNGVRDVGVSDPAAGVVVELRPTTLSDQLREALVGHAQNAGKTLGGDATGSTLEV